MNKSDIDWAKNLSATIDLLRFPLAIAVIFIHMNPETINLRDANFSINSGHGIYNIIGIVMSHVLTHIAVPVFFLVSGFLFFFNFKQWSWCGYKNKIKSRIKSLLIPYVAWNLLAFIISLCVIIGGVVIKGNSMQNVYDFISNGMSRIFIDYHIWGTSRVNILGCPCYSTGPLDLPLWFLRDLIVVSFMTPLIYFFVKKTKTIGVFLLFVAYVTRVWILVPGFSITALFYFALGAYFAINNRNFVRISRKYSHITIPLSILLFILCVYYDGTRTIIGDNLMRFYVVTTVFVSFSIASALNEKYRIKANPLLVKGCFFVYASHTVAIFAWYTPMGLAECILHKTIPGESGLEEGICYILVPFLAAALCILTYMLLSRFLPKVCAILSGNRV